MQFKAKKQFVDSSKTKEAWHQWLVKSRGETITLLVYTYGTAVARVQDLEEFTTACIWPDHTDCAGATAECSLRDVVARL